MTMIERVARHMHAKLHLMVGGYRDFDSLSSGDPDLDRYDCKEWWIEHARAAIEAMREPAGVMTVAMITTSPGLAIEDMDDAWRAAIDAALKEDKA